MLVGAGLAGIGTMLPWAEGVYWGVPFGWSGWDLYYLHGPMFTAAIPPLIFAVATTSVAIAAIRRPAAVRLALGPGMLLIGYVIFTFATYEAGPFGASIQQLPGYSSSFLGDGFWLMASGALVIVASGVAADPAAPDVVRLRVATWFIVALFEFALLFSSPAIFFPVFLVAATVAAMARWVWTAGRRHERGPSASSGIGQAPDTERLDPERSGRLSQPGPKP